MSLLSLWNLPNPLSKIAFHAWKWPEYYFLWATCMICTSDVCKPCSGHPSITQQLKDTFSKNKVPNAMNWQRGMCKIATWWTAEAGASLLSSHTWQCCVLTQAPIAVARATGTKCPLSGPVGNPYTYLDLKCVCKYLATCQWKHSQEGYLNCQRMITKTNQHDAAMDKSDSQQDTNLSYK
jgi:hypothetical protein